MSVLMFISFFTFIFHFFLQLTEQRAFAAACVFVFDFGIIFVISQKIFSVVKQTSPPKVL